MSKRSRGYEQQKATQTDRKCERDAWMANLTPEQKALQTEAARLTNAWKKAKGEKARNIRQAHNTIIARLQEELIHPKTDSTFTHTEPGFDREHKIHARIKGL